MQNPTIRHLWPIAGALHPPNSGGTVEGRPLVNLSLALNYAISGLHPRSHHVLNLAVHLLAGLVLFGLARRTLRGRDPDPLLFGFSVALIWTVHPLLTQSVTAIADRARIPDGTVLPPDAVLLRKRG